MVLVLGELGEFGNLGAVIGDQLGEPVLDGLPVFAGGTGVVPALVADSGLGFEFGDYGALAPFDVADLLAQCTGALGGAVCCFCGGSVAGELGGQQLAAVRAEDALGEEAVRDIEQDVLAGPQAGRVARLPGGALRVVALVGFAGLVGQVAAGLAEHAPAAQVADDVGAQRVGPGRPRMAAGAGADTRSLAHPGGGGGGLEQRLGCPGRVSLRTRSR
jgi:hypothetical protein